MFALHIETDAWRWRTPTCVVADLPTIVPVAKGNGYGFGLSSWRPRPPARCDTFAVGTLDELPEVHDAFGGDVLVLTPWHPFGAAVELDAALERRVVHTVGRTADLAGLLERHPQARFVLERLTSMRRHGFTAEGLREAADLLRGRGFAPGDARLRGVALHLPLAAGRPPRRGRTGCSTTSSAPVSAPPRPGSAT